MPLTGRKYLDIVGFLGGVDICLENFCSECPRHVCPCAELEIWNMRRSWVLQLNIGCHRFFFRPPSTCMASVFLFWLTFKFLNEPTIDTHAACPWSVCPPRPTQLWYCQRSYGHHDDQCPTQDFLWWTDVLSSSYGSTQVPIQSRQVDTMARNCLIQVTVLITYLVQWLP